LYYKLGGFKMRKNILIVAALVTTLTFLVVVLAISINHRTYYRGHTIDEWFNSKDRQEKVEIFHGMGTKSFPFLMEKLNGQFSDQDKACSIIGDAFQNSQVENSDIETKLRTMLMTGNQALQIEAYAAIRKLNLTIPDSEIAIAARSCPSVRMSEEEFISRPKLAHLYSMTNSVDCDFVALLCNDKDPQVQMQTLAFLGELRDDSLCDEKIETALTSLMKGPTDASILKMALGYISTTPKRISENSKAVCCLLEITNDDDLQMDCLAELAALARTEPLPSEVKRSIESILSRSDLKPDVRRQARDDLDMI
jgi:hypothetical protein